MKTHTAIEVAKQFLTLAKTDENHLSDISNMKLQKLCFFAHLSSVLAGDSPTLISDPFHAWDYGPVEPKLYRKIKRFGPRFFSLDDEEVGVAFGDVEPITDSDANAAIIATWDKFKNWSSVQLSALTHRRNSPWSHVYNTNRYGVISDADILRYRLGDA